ncbi:MAG: PDZ domain-containing protein [Dehalococcoidia bacterium]|nr:PDZ domain-containing protein [Dehalococcoidia bacterium]
MTSWRRRIVLPIVGAVVVVLAVAAWGLPQARASIQALGHGNTAVFAQAQDPKPFIGISLAEINAQIKSRLQLTQDTGVVIVMVAPNSPGATAGLQQKDIITAIDGSAVKAAQDVTTAVQAKKVGDTVKLTITRSDGSHDITVTLGATPARPNAAPKGQNGAPVGPNGAPAGPNATPKGQNGAPKGPNGAPVGPLGGFLGANPGQNLQNATITVKDKDGNTRTLDILAGAIQIVDSTHIVVTPNGASSTADIKITADTRTGRVKAGDMKANDRVIVVVENGNALQISDLSATVNKGADSKAGGGNNGNDSGVPNQRRGVQNMPFHQFGPGNGGQPSTPKPTTPSSLSS